ncbi:MAG: hypothetical protein ACRYG7_26780 [Janthinobacterium lividum]
MKNILLLCACLLALVAPLRAAVAPPADIVVVRIYDSGASINAVITRDEGKSEKVTFNSGATDKRLTESSLGYYKLISKLYQEGYKLQSTISDGRSDLITLLFVKAL